MAKINLKTDSASACEDAEQLELSETAETQSGSNIFGKQSGVFLSIYPREIKHINPKNMSMILYYLHAKEFYNRVLFLINKK